MFTSKKADALAAHATQRAAVASHQRSHWELRCTKPAMGSHAVRWTDPAPLPTSRVFRYLRGVDAQRTQKRLDDAAGGDAGTVDGIDALTQSTYVRADAPTRLDYQQLRNRKSRQKWDSSGRRDRSKAQGDAAADAARRHQRL
eukprot:CAMPEP_0174850834 /NCGR_PEP_ID=MMETSP1114-20130205/21163_1 /TAXON_ID=312471 /ORGANISM="Neobodo designis, Strain CCAP 1951/1" /LENGTH=142 /DNA_ID=CAMNT_0016085321 /DNA_START=78 /DNA_END=506 /DNA_ORIENTATION=+